MQLRPQEHFTIVRQLEDHTDTGTYYVRAVIRNARTDALIDTINLSDKGNRRFTGDWQVTPDVSGEGFYISILTTVYTDSGYTTKSENYGEKIDTYLVQDRMNPNLGMGGGGADVDYKKIQKMIDNAVESIVIPEQKEVDLKPLLGAINTLHYQIAAIKLPEPEKLNLQPVLDAIKAIRIPKSEKLDLSPVLDALDSLSEDVASQLKAQFAPIVENVRQLLTVDTEEIKATGKSIEQKLDQMPYVVLQPQQQSQKQQRTFNLG
jgi:hypothetical protein